MESYHYGNLAITCYKEGANHYSKVTYPIRYGRFCEIKTPEFIFQCNLNGEIKYIQGLTRNWPHPAEWLKRTDANDWVFYSAGLYKQMFSFLGEYYLPCLSYPSNSPWKYNPFTDYDILRAMDAWSQLRSDLCSLSDTGLPTPIRDYLSQIFRHDVTTLNLKTTKLHRIIGGPVSVLPPDTRHVDYHVIPLMIADGCLYNCSFCRIKSRQRFRSRPKDNLLDQIRRLQKFYGDDLENYNAVFLGNHDALATGSELVCTAAFQAYEAFGFERSYIKNPTLFLFGSVDSLLEARNSLFDALNQIPMYSYINIGLESVDAATLAQINKPLEARKVEDAFDRMLEINQSFLNIEVTVNFLLGDALSPDHYRTLIELLRNRLDRYYSKGAIYLSPLDSNDNNRQLLRTFIDIKNLSRLPTYIYLIQRL
jgi:radical SAM superfamily enzyme YgiQ (UPF0313 family)